MGDPHVVALRYRVAHPENSTFEDPAPVSASTEHADLTLELGGLVATLRVHYSTVVAARASVDPFLRAWELDAALRFGGHREIWFEFTGADVVDRAPPPTPPPRSGQVVTPSAAAFSLSVGRCRVVGVHRSYPPAPAKSSIAPDVDSMWHRFEGFRAGREPLLSMAYFCLTVLDWASGGRRSVPTQVGVERAVIKKLGDLASERGDMRTARKIKVGKVMVPLSLQESRWVEATVLALIRRAWAGQDGTVLRMADLPPLS
jgi:hypothetical protein